MDGGIKFVNFAYGEWEYGEIGGLAYSITDELGKPLIRNAIQFSLRTPKNAVKCLRMLADDLEKKAEALE